MPEAPRAVEEPLTTRLQMGTLFDVEGNLVAFDEIPFLPGDWVGLEPRYSDSTEAT